MAPACELPRKQARATAQIQHVQRLGANLHIVEPVIVVGAVQPVIKGNEPAICILGILHPGSLDAEVADRRYRISRSGALLAIA
jgi:hypothetical protein